MDIQIATQIIQLDRRVSVLETLEIPGNFTPSGILFANASGMIAQDSSLLWDSLNDRLTVAGAIVLGAGASFPASPPTNGVYFRTDRGTLHYYDGAQWLSLDSYQVRFPFTTFSATTEDTTHLEAMEGDFAPYFIRADIIVNTGATNNGSNFWTVRLRGGASVSIVSGDTSAIGTNQNRIRLTLGTMTQLGATTAFTNMRVEKTGTPSDLSMYAIARYKLIG